MFSAKTNIIETEEPIAPQKPAINPQLVHFKETKIRVFNNIEKLSQSFSCMIEDLKYNVLEPITKDTRDYYAEIRSLENQSDECQNFKKTISAFCTSQKSLSNSFEKILVSLGAEKEVIKKYYKTSETHPCEP